LETTECKIYLLLISADSAKNKEKRQKAMLPAGDSKSTAHTVFFIKFGMPYSLIWIQFNYYLSGLI
jgi:hypothetical protein